MLEINLSQKEAKPLDEFAQKQNEFVNNRFMEQYGKSTAIYGKMHAGSATTITSGSPVQINLNTEDFSSGVTLDTANNRIVINYAGYYQINCTLSITSVLATNFYDVYVYVNGSEAARCRQHASLAVSIIPSINDILYLNSGDYVEMWCFQQSGSSAGVNQGANQTRLSIHKI